MRRFSGMVVAVLLGACSSSPVDDVAAAPAEDTTVYDHCVDFATRLCDDAKDCCTQTYGDYDAEGCVDTFKREVCRPGSSAVKAGRAQFDADAVDACLAAHAQAHAVCVPTWKQTLELRKAIYTACRVIDGLSEPGKSCTTAATCKHPEGAATSDCVKNVCTVIAVLPEGAECQFPQGAVSVCDEGLTCDSAGQGDPGHCVKALATGDACDACMLEGTECGLGNYCDGATSQCKVTENLGGNGCSQGTECVSFKCDRTSQECAPAPAVVSRDTCLGAAPQP